MAENYIIADSGAIGEFKLDCLTVIINHLETYEKNLIKLDQQHIYL